MKKKIQLFFFVLPGGDKVKVKGAINKFNEILRVHSIFDVIYEALLNILFVFTFSPNMFVAFDSFFLLNSSFCLLISRMLPSSTFVLMWLLKLAPPMAMRTSVGMYPGFGRSIGFGIKRSRSGMVFV